jgi:hypothetical protein
VSNDVAAFEFAGAEGISVVVAVQNFFVADGALDESEQLSLAEVTW